MSDDATYVYFQVFVQVVGEHEVMRHGQPMGLHGMIIAIVRGTHVRVVKVGDAILGWSHRRSRPSSSRRRRRRQVYPVRAGPRWVVWRVGLSPGLIKKCWRAANSATGVINVSRVFHHFCPAASPPIDTVLRRIFFYFLLPQVVYHTVEHLMAWGRSRLLETKLLMKN